MAQVMRFILQGMSSGVSIEDPIFKLYSVFTSRVLLALSLFTFIKSLTAPMVCYGIDDKVIDKSSLGAYCQLQDSYGIPNYQEQTATYNASQASQPENQIYYSYYSMISLFIAIQSIFFYIPHYIWTSTENGNTANLTFCFHYPIAEYKDEVLCQEEQDKRMKLIVGYLVRSWGKHRNKAFVYWVCVALNFAVALAQVGIIDAAFSSEFSSQGVTIYKNVMWTDHQQRNDQLSRFFPRIITCNFREITQDGVLNSHTSFCVMPFNHVNERLLILTLSWFLLLSIIGLVSFLSWAFTFCIPCCQNRFLGNSKHFVTPNMIELIMEKFEPSNVGDWFVLWLLSKNMNSIHYEKLLIKLSNYKTEPAYTESPYRPLLSNKNDQSPINSHETYDNL